VRAFGPVALCLVAAGCATASEPPAASASRATTTDPIAEEDAIAVIDEVLIKSSVQPVAGWRVALQQAQNALDVDVRLGDSSFGIEWVSPSDRQSLGGALPRPDPNGQLRLLQGRVSEGTAQPLILLLDAESYGMPRRPRHAGRLAPSADREARERLRRDVSDFLDYVRGQYRL
jgi:hypothetical protein